MELSIVTTLYYSAPHLEQFYARVCAAADKITDDYELILVNDGSPDPSLKIALALYEKDKRVRVIDLSRNYGHHRAIMTGLAQARGDLVFLIDCDLEEEPEYLSQFYPELKRANVDVVYGVQQARKGSFLERISGTLYYRLFNLLSTDPVTPNLTTARLMTRRYVAALVAHKERELCFSGVCAATGFAQTAMTVVKHCRGETTYTLSRRASNLVNGITSFSNKPLVFIFYLGCGIVFISGLAALYLIMRRIFFGVYLAGWPSLVVSVWLLGGLTIFCLGVIGIYLSKMFVETKQRPYTIIRQTYERSGQNKDALQPNPEPRQPVL